jgi:hypothetical protein
MTSRERNGRILLAAAVLLLFLVVVASMIAGRLPGLALIIVALLAIVGGALMVLGRST